MNSIHLAPAIVVPYIIGRVYWRVRRNIGRQRVRPKLMKRVLVLFGAISLLTGVVALTYPPSFAALVVGLLAGGLLALAALRCTRFEQTADGDFYIPNLYLGLALTLLLVGRMVYRTMVLFVRAPVAGPPPPAFFKSPLTLLFFGLAAGYYIAYDAGVLAHARKLPPAQ